MKFWLIFVVGILSYCVAPQQMSVAGDKRISEPESSDVISLLAFSRGGQTLATATSRLEKDKTLVRSSEIKLWDVSTGELKQNLPRLFQDEIWDIALSPDGQTVAAAAQRMIGMKTIGGLVLIWNAKTGALLHSIPVQESPTYSVVFSPDGRTLATANSTLDQNSNALTTVIHIWDVKRGVLIRTHRPHVAWMKSLSFSPDGTMLAGGGVIEEAHLHTGVVRMWNTRTGVLERTFIVPEHVVFHVRFSPDNRHFATASHRSTGNVSWPISDIQLWNLDSGQGQLLKTERGVLVSDNANDFADDIGFSNDGTRLVEVASLIKNYNMASAKGFSVVRLWNVTEEHTGVSQGYLMSAIPLSQEESPNPVILSPDAKTVVGSYISLKIWDVLTGEVEASWKVVK